MTDAPSKPGQDHEQSSVGSVRSASRRRLLQAGISAAPVVMTVASRPVLAITNPPGFCQSPSGAVSGNLSRPNIQAACAGRTPGYWKQPQHYNDWNGYTPTGGSATVFKNVLSPDLPVSNLTFLCALDPQCSGSGPPYDVARHIVAAILNNAATNPTTHVPESILPLATIKAMWTQYNATGMYSVSAGVFWNGDQLIAYLLSTVD